MKMMDPHSRRRSQTYPSMISPHVLFPSWSKLGCKVTSTDSKALQDHIDHIAKD